MPNAVVKNVLISVILVVLCIVVGAQVAESRNVSVGILAALVAGCFMLWIGPRCWVLIYLAPPIMTFLPIPGKLAQLPVIFLISNAMLAYWVVMRGMGYVRFAWRSLWIMDLLVAVLFCYMVASFVRHPVSMAVFGWDTEYVGGKEYFWAVTATVHYIALSCIPCTHEQFQKIVKWGVRLSCGAAILSVALRLLGIRGGTSLLEVADAAAGSRFSMFVQLGIYGIYWFYGMYPILRVFTSFSIFFAVILSLIGILLSGSRETLMGNCFVIAALSIVKREFWCFTLLSIMAYGVVLYLSAEGIVKEMPHGIQRCFSMLPGVEIQRDIKEGTSHSSEWRIVMWKWALDPRTGYIQDYTWGDGFGQSVDYLRRETTAMMRGTSQFGDREFFAVTGTWHSGFITTLHRLGYVGVGLVAIVYLYGLCMLIRVCMALRGTSLFFPCIFFCMDFAGQPFIFFISAGTIPYFFRGYMYLTFIKMFYCIGREQGIIIPWMQRQRYVPLAIQQIEEKLRPSAP